MNETQRAGPATKAGFGGEEIGILDMMNVLARHKKAVLGLPIAAALVCAAFSMTLPGIYKANAVLLPPQQQQSSASALLSQLGGAASMAAGAAGIKNPNDMYIGMLKSRTVADRLIDRFKLKGVYNTTSDETARQKLGTNTAIISGKDGLISIEVENEDPKLVAQLSNAYVDELLRLTRVLAVTEASQRRMFFERQLELAKNNLAKAEISLKNTMETSGVISVDVQSRGLVETLARLRAQISAKTIELNSMRAFITSNNPTFQRLSEEISSLRAELSKLENGSGERAAPAGQGTKGGLDNTQRLRDLKYYQTLYELLSKQYEVARLDEAKEPSIVQVLDQATVPERPIKPKRLLMVLMGGLAGLVLSIGWVFFAEARQRTARKPASAAAFAGADAVATKNAP